MLKGALARLPDWLVIGQEEWNEVERRNQLVLRALAARNPRSRFLFAEIPLRPREIRRWRLPCPMQVAPNIWRMRAIRPLPEAGGLGQISDRSESAQIRRALRVLNIERPALWTQDPRAVTLVDRLPLEQIVYDLTDDWAAFETDPVREAQVQSRIEELGSRADVVLACSRPLERDARRWSNRVQYLPNAVDPPGLASTPPDDVATLPSPRLGYVGTLHSSRLDVELLARSAEQRDTWSFVLVGPDELEPGDRKRLLGLSNVHYLGVRPHAAVRAYLEAFDVCLLPHLVTPFTRSLDPLKLYEYLAAGRPVVSTPTGNAPDLEEHLAWASTPEELVVQAERALRNNGDDEVSARRAAVAAETWEARAREVERVLGVPGSQNEGARQISVVVVSHNTRDLLARCLTALASEKNGHVLAIVVDNGSTDGTVGMVRETFPDTELIELQENAGFGRANNIAFERCQGEHVLLLNSDAFLAPGVLDALVAAAQRHPNACAVGPRLLNPDGTLQRSAWPFPSAGRLLLEALLLHRPLRRLGVLEDLGTWNHDGERAVDFLIGACLLVRREAVAEVGGFDEGFWLYGEEADLQRRMAARGWQVVFTPTVTVTHVGGASSAASAVRLRHFYTGQRRFLMKHGRPLAWPVARLALLVGSLLRGRWDAARLALQRRL